jgi:HPt (histidine-containing phosphotransfer) domain-containing protein
MLNALSYTSSLLPQNPVDSPFIQIMRAAHVIKGAASNLMCAQLRYCAMNLETVASAAANDAAAQSNPSVLQSVQARHLELQVAVQNYHAYLLSVGV